jgi:excinuclease UvrABC nuclease subunit
MSKNAYVYLLRDQAGRIVYVGKGDRQRPYQPHNDSYEEARKLSSDVLITAVPFSTEDDAELAESLLIRVLADNGTGLVNRAQMVQSS